MITIKPKSVLMPPKKALKSLLIVSLLFLLLSIPSLLFAQQAYIVSMTPEEVLLAENICGISFEVVNVNNGNKEIILSEEQLNKLKKGGLFPPIKTSEADLLDNLRLGKLLDGYRSYDEILATLQDYANNYPDICQLYDIGNSLGKEYWYQGYDAYEDYQHDIWALKISDNPGIEEDEPSLLFDAAHHARETIAPAVVMNFTQYLFDNYGVDPEITDAIHNNQIWIVPIVNPDGYKIVIDSLEVWWRKTIRDNNDNHQIDPFLPDWIEPDGVDPNRNYGSYWGGDWTTAPSFRETYRGPWSFSEPCIQAMKDLLGSHHFVTEFSYHSYGEKFFYPWSYDPIQYQSPDHLLFSTLGSELGNMTPRLDGGKYLAYPFGTFVMLSGSTMDYAYGKYGVIGYCVELAQDFIPPPEDIIPVCEANLASQLFILSRVHESILTGHVTDAASGLPLVARMFVEGIDNDSQARSDYKSDSLFGRFYRLLNPGDYDVTFNAFGYLPQTFSININNSGPTSLEISLEHDTPFQFTGTVKDSNGNPVSDAHIVLVNVPVDTLYSDGSGLFTIDPFYAGQYYFKVSAEGYFTNNTSVEVDEQNNELVFILKPYEIIDFEDEEELDYFTMKGHQDWSRDDQIAYHEDYSLVCPVLSMNQFASTSIELYFAEDKLMSLATQVSLDSITQGMIFTMDERIMKTYYGNEDWVSDTFYIPAGMHFFRWSLSRDWKTPGLAFQNKCWIDKISFQGYATSLSEYFIEPRALFSVFPNPSRGTTTISLAPDVRSVYFAGVYNISGELINILNTSKSSSEQILWDGNSESGMRVPAGIYVIRIVTDKGIWGEKCVIY